jgi:membrane-associated phospholipid phosphatase
MREQLRLLLFFFLLISPLCISSQNSDATWPTFLQKSGDVIQIGLPAGALMETLINKDKEGFKQFSISFGVNFLTTHALKRIIRKKRPDPSNAYNAMPSGHTSASFQAATFIHIRYGYKYGIPAYLLASYVGYSRVKGVDTKHDVWDVLGGAALGSLTSYLFTTTKDKNHKITPTLTTGSVMLTLQVNIK